MFSPLFAFEYQHTFADGPHLDFPSQKRCHQTKNLTGIYSGLLPWHQQEPLVEKREIIHNMIYITFT